MRAIEQARSVTRLSRVKLDELDRSLKSFRENRVDPYRHGRIHNIPISEEPRTDVSSELLAEKPWLRFYSPNVPLEPEINDDTLPDLLVKSVRQFPDHVALTFFGNRLTYRELDTAVCQFANGLWELGIRPGERVALLLPNCPQFVIAYYGALRIGAIVIPCNPLYTGRELEQQIRDSGASVLVTLTFSFKVAKTVCETLGLKHLIVGNIKDYFPPALQLAFTVAKEKKEGHRAEVSGNGVYKWSEFLAAQAYKDKVPQVEVKADDVALLQYTGGTTGIPKGAMLTHRNLVTNARMCWDWIGGGDMGRDITLAAIPFFHVYGMTTALNLSVMVGGDLVMVPRFTPLDVLKAIQRYRPTLFPGVPAMYIALLNHPQVTKFDLSSVEACLSGAAPLPMEVAHRFEKLTGAKLIEGYGMTESSPVSHANPVFGRRKEGSIGLPFPGIRAKIVDLDTGETDLPPGEVGELVLSGPTIMQGYYNRPGETVNALRAGWLYTGDIARMDEEGYFYIVDRKKDMILSNGFNVYPRDVEEILYQHPAVREAVVIGAPNERGDDTVKAFIVLQEEQRATAEEIIAFCRERLARYKAPRAVEFRTELPKSMIGKHLRRVLVEEERNRLAAKQLEAAPAENTPVKSETHARKSFRLPDNITKNLPKVTITVTMPENFHMPKPRIRLPFNLVQNGRQDKAAS
ncbi:MAG TPA: long-chain fatty acid--CoA ligase [Chloroflexia bacterium]|nr:long-chain fatty acid--CoA ligase [Chloroflexia bacterium]